MRDEFLGTVREQLAYRAAFRCSNPDCECSTAGPSAQATGKLSIGVAAHITAASIGGPRYDATLSSNERCSMENGIWLCQNCAKRIDSDPVAYPTTLLRSWRADAETAARSSLGTPVSPSQEKPLQYSMQSDPAVEVVAKHWNSRGYSTFLAWVYQKEAKLLEGYELARDPQTGREIWVVFDNGLSREEHVLLANPNKQS
jgi:hypothetical protein